MSDHLLLSSLLIAFCIAAVIMLRYFGKLRGDRSFPAHEIEHHQQARAAAEQPNSDEDARYLRPVEPTCR